jgi:hypothetical protein
MRLAMVAKKKGSETSAISVSFIFTAWNHYFFNTKIGVAFEKCKTSRGASIGIKRSIFVDPVLLRLAERRAVFGIWIRIRMFLGLPDPDPLPSQR